MKKRIKSAFFCKFSCNYLCFFDVYLCVLTARTGNFLFVYNLQFLLFLQLYRILQIEKIHACKKYVFDFSVFERVIYDFSVAALGYDVRRAQKSQLVRASGLIYAEDSRQIAYAHFAYAKRADNFVSSCVRAGGKKFRKRMKRCVARYVVEDGLFVDVVDFRFHT